MLGAETMVREYGNYYACQHYARQR